MAEFDSKPGTDDPLILEIRERFTYCVDSWRDIRDEAKKDMKYIAGDPWEPRERKARKDAGRPCLALDELNQYVNQLINDIRQNKRAIKVIPTGVGAKDKIAELRAAQIRQIEYKSSAQSAYATGFENAACRSYGYWRVSTQYINDTSFDQELTIRRIPNPDTIYLDPDCKEADCSDMDYCFVIDYMPRSVFKRKFPRAQFADFTSEHAQAAPLWIREDQVQVAEYWKVEKTYSKITDSKGIQREVEKRKICQYLTNGIEILEEHEWAGKYVPIVPVFGREMFVDKGAGSERVIMSLVRLARDPYMLYCYYRTCQAEVVGMTPKTPFIGYEGQFDGHEDEWQNVNKAPIPYLQVKPLTDGTGANMLPLPQRQPYEPAIQALEMGAESAKRAIQSAMGRYNTSVGRSDSSARSGIAIRALDQQSDQGSFHFIDNFDRALEHTGRILNDMIPRIYDTERQVGIRKPDDSFALATVNGVQPDGSTLNIGEGEYDVTISTGPSYQSQREEANIFLETLAGVQMQNTLFPRVADLAIKAKNLGPIGDEMAKRLVPPEFASQDGQEPLPPQIAQAMQKAQKELESLNAYAKSLEEQMGQMKAKEDAKVADNQQKMELEKLKIEAQITIAQIGAKTQESQTRMKMEQDMWIQLHSSSHELGLQKDQQAADMQMQAQMQQEAAEQAQQQEATAPA